jgi:hypothetical protein
MLDLRHAVMSAPLHIEALTRRVSDTPADRVNHQKATYPQIFTYHVRFGAPLSVPEAPSDGQTSTGGQGRGLHCRRTLKLGGPLDSPTKRQERRLPVATITPVVGEG